MFPSLEKMNDQIYDYATMTTTNEELHDLLLDIVYHIQSVIISYEVEKTDHRKSELIVMTVLCRKIWKKSSNYSRRIRKNHTLFR